MKICMSYSERSHLGLHFAASDRGSSHTQISHVQSVKNERQGGSPRWPANWVKQHLLSFLFGTSHPFFYVKRTEEPIYSQSSITVLMASSSLHLLISHKFLWAYFLFTLRASHPLEGLFGVNSWVLPNFSDRVDPKGRASRGLSFWQAVLWHGNTENGCLKASSSQSRCRAHPWKWATVSV